jgi:hypothetical protein
MDGELRRCVCKHDCEALTKALFAPGHDSKLRAELERRVGGLLSLRRLLENCEMRAAGEITPDELSRVVLDVLRGKAGLGNPAGR